MKNSNIKKAGLALLTTAVLSSTLFTNTSGAEAERYNLNKTVKTYMNAADAKLSRNSVGRYGQGQYYVYKRYNGAVNISRQAGQAGAWIVDAGNKVNSVVYKAASVKKSENAVNKKVGNKVILTNPEKVYMSALDAKLGRNAVKSYSAGEYYIYKEFNGFYNISRRQGSAGGWIAKSAVKNEQAIMVKEVVKSTPVAPKIATPVVKKVEVKKEAPKVQEAKTYELKERKAAYANAADARNQRNPRTSYGPGKYYIFKEYNGMINISTSQNSAGGWINPNAKEVKVETKTHKAVKKTASTTVKAEVKKEAPKQATAAPTKASNSNIESIARQYLGYRYVWGGSSPSGFDCSGFTSYVYRKAGISISRTSRAQYAAGTKVSKANLRSGDLVFFGSSARNISHVGIYIGNGQLIHASTPSTGVIISSMNSNWYIRNYVGAARY